MPSYGMGSMSPHQRPLFIQQKKKKKGLSVQNTGTVLYFGRYFKAGEEVTAPIEGKAFTSPQAIKYKHFSGR